MICAGAPGRVPDDKHANVQLTFVPGPCFDFCLTSKAAS